MDSPAQRPAVIRFGSFELDAAAGELRESGRPCSLPAQPLRVLALLTERAGETVTRQEIRRCMWGDRKYVDVDRGINFCLNQIRNALRDPAGKSRYIKTLPRRGYRFIAPTTRVAPLASAAPFIATDITEAGSHRRATAAWESLAGAATPARTCAVPTHPVEALPARFTDRFQQFVRRNGALAGVIATAVAAILVAIGYALHRGTATEPKIAADAVAVPAPTLASAPVTGNFATPVAASLNPMPSIVVLPFVDMSEKKDQEYFSDGLSEELIELLGKTPGLRVIPRTSSFYFKGKTETLETIAAQLHVANALEGSVRKSGHRLRVTAQLVRADNSEHLWSQTYDRELRDVFQVQDEIAGAVVSALQVKLGAAQPAPYVQRTSNLEAHYQYLVGRQFFHRATIDGFRRAAAAFRRAVELDPGYATAYAELARVESYVADQTGDAAEQRQALAAADKAVELAPEEAAAYATRGYMRVRRTWDWSGAQADFEKGLALDPSNGKLLWQHATLLAALGRLPEAVAAAKKATELDPLSSATWFHLGLYLIQSREFVAAHEAVRRFNEITPESELPLSFLGKLQLLEGKPTEALATFRPLSDYSLRLPGIAEAEHTLGHARESQQALDQLIARGGQPWALRIAEIYAWRGEKDKAFEWLDRAYEQHYSDLHFFRNEPMLASLRDDARFAAVLRKMNLPE